jgi:hypothetical protein
LPDRVLLAGRNRRTAVLIERMYSSVSDTIDAQRAQVR